MLGLSCCTVTERAAFLLVALCVFLVPSVWAQPDLSIKRLQVNWPDVEMELGITCGGTERFNLNIQDYTVKENGKVIPGHILWCPDTSDNCSKSVILAFDASFSMTGSGQAGAKQAGHGFIDLMDGVLDEASVIWFNSTVTIFQQMTTIKPMLHSAVDALPATGSTALWDGAYASLVELINNGVNQCRAVVLLSDGTDNASIRTADEVVALAKRHRIPVYTVGLGGLIDAPELQRLAQESGGEFFQTPNAGQLLSIYREIFGKLKRIPMGCWLRYESQCPDGSERDVFVEVRNVCGGSDTAVTSFTPPLDSSSFRNVAFTLEQALGARDSDVRMPVLLATNMAGVTLEALGLRLLFDTNRVRLVGAEGAAGSLYDGAVFTITPIPGGALVETAETRIAQEPGKVFDLIFHTNPSDTGCADIRGGASWFTRGCMIPQVGNGTICIYQNKPVVHCDLQVLSTVLWDGASGRYDPEQFPALIRLRNDGGVDAELLHVAISVDGKDLQLLSPLRDTVFLPGTRILPGKHTSVGWDVAALMRADRKVTRLCISASFANHAPVNCCTDIVIEAAAAKLRCDLQVDAVTADTLAQRYLPMPFQVSMQLQNNGGVTTDTVWATIELPPDLALAPPDAPSAFTKLCVPATLGPGATGQISWMLSHPLTREDRNYTIVVKSYAAGSDTTSCQADISIPAIPEVYDTLLRRPLRTVLCEGEITTLDAGTGYFWYRWNTGHTGQWLTVVAPGQYFCFMMNSDGKLFLSDTVTVTLVPAPTTPVITRNGNVLTCMPPQHKYQWFRDGQPIAGASGQSHTATETGSYTVRIETADSCTAFSQPFDVSVLSAGLPAFVQSFDVWPEPNDGRLHVRIVTDLPCRSVISVRNMLGQEIAMYDSRSAQMEYIEDIDLDRAPAGVYFLHVSSGEASWVRAVVRAR
jgi:hypothetical protein